MVVCPPAHRKGCRRMTLAQIYSRFKLPPNLVRHMAEVAAVSLFIVDHWSGEEKFERKLVIEAALVHDLANIIKFKRPFKGELETNGEHWQKVQSEIIYQYGQDVHTATLQMMREAGLARVIPIIEDMFGMYTRDLKDGEKEPSVESRIIELADDCVAPEGIVGFEERMKDLYQRYNFDENDPKAQRLIANKDWVQARIDVDLAQVDWGKVREMVGEYGEYEMVDEKL